MMLILQALFANLCIASLVWVLATWRRDASLVDLIWPLFYIVSAWVWFDPQTAGPSQWLVLVVVMAWGGRLHVYLARRNLGHGEDRRYQKIREANSPGFWWKSYFLVFVLQALLAWLVALPLFEIFQGSQGLGGWQVVGITLATFGLIFEAVADWQLASFKARPENHDKVMDQGLWGLSRHPNYFGECCVWWGIFLAALPHGWWSLFSPLIMTGLLLRVSGVALLEKDIDQRRPRYADYIASTPAFLPDFRRCIRRGKQ